MGDELKIQEDEILNSEDGFLVKGKPAINLENTTDSSKSHIATILKQKIEELKQSEKKQQILITTVGAEFKPENMPYIPDSNHPALLKHDLSTIERNAGYQDSSLVPPMYKDQMKKPEKPIELTSVDIPDGASNIDILMGAIENITKPEFKSVIQGKPAQFTMNISRERMHHGGIYMPNESRPYRPGE